MPGNPYAHAVIDAPSPTVDRTELRNALFAEWDASTRRASTLRSVGYRRGLEHAIKIVDPEFYANEMADDDEDES